MFRILAISTGSTSTKVGVFLSDKLVSGNTVRHSAEELAGFDTVVDQHLMRKNAIVRALESSGEDPACFHAAVSVGGTMKPMPGGTYVVNDKMTEDILAGRVYMMHASLLGALICRELERDYGVKALTVDPVTTDEFVPLARVSGFKEVPRLSQAHALNAKATARRVAASMGRNFSESSFVVAHMGGGASVSAIQNGKIVDSLTSRQDGAFSSEAAGAIPGPDFVDWLISAGADVKALKALKSLWFGKGGLVSLTGSNDIQQIQQRMHDGDEQAALALRAMAYSTSKSIGAMCAALSGFPDAIVLTGGAAYSLHIVEWIKRRVGFLAPVHVVPGEDELPALAEAALRVLNKQEEAQEYV